MRNFFQQLTVAGHVSQLFPKESGFELTLLNGDKMRVTASKTTYYEVLRNVGDVWRDRVAEPNEKEVEAMIGSRSGGDPLYDTKRSIIKYLSGDKTVTVVGIFTQNDDKVSFDAKRVVLMHHESGRFGFEDTHWWLQQINTLFEQWLDVLFEERRVITKNDFAQFYRTSLDLLGGRTDYAAQECATMSRFLYGLSSSYLLTGNERALSAASACAEYLIEAFSVISHDRRYCFWKFGRVLVDGRSTKDIVPSQNPDDLNSYALYEQIYALSGLTQYYRITQDTNILKYITMTIATFEDFYRDEERPGDSCFTGKGGYFSHIDTVTMRPDSPALQFNNNNNIRKKNWNSIGDHIPAYLVNLLLSIDPLPSPEFMKLRTLCRHILDDCVDNILNHFFTKDSVLVNERFDADWNQDLTWGWQQNRGIVGHNLKIAWNLTRCGHYYKYLESSLKAEGLVQDAARYAERAKRCYDKATYLGDIMDPIGVDQVRGGIWDAIERIPNANGVYEFAWGDTKDFWQQEQAILAYYILHGIDGLPKEKADRYLTLARSCAAFWNAFFIDQDHRKIYFRTDESGMPVIEGQYGIQGGHAIAGYHAFELNYLAHIYIRTFVGKQSDDNFALTFCPKHPHNIRAINVLPDFMPPGEVSILSVRVNGRLVDVPNSTKTNFQIDISRYEPDCIIEVEFTPIKNNPDSPEDILRNRKTTEELAVNFGTN